MNATATTRQETHMADHKHRWDLLLQSTSSDGRRKVYGCKDCIAVRVVVTTAELGVDASVDLRGARVDHADVPCYSCGSVRIDDGIATGCHVCANDGAGQVGAARPRVPQGAPEPDPDGDLH